MHAKIGYVSARLFLVVIMLLADAIFAKPNRTPSVKSYARTVCKVICKLLKDFRSQVEQLEAPQIL